MEKRNARIQFFIDQPTNLVALGRCVVFRGWCFAANGESVRAIRLQVGNMILTGKVGLPRPDVRATLSAAPDDNTGFEIRGTLVAGHHKLSLEAALSDGIWHPLLIQVVAVKSTMLPRWLGGGSATELLAFQMPPHMAYPPRYLQPEKFPARLPQASRPKLSIVTPSYQQARFLEQTLRGVLEQNAAVDYVVQDGGSLDGSKELIERLAAENEDRRPETGSKGTQAPAPGQLPRLVSWASEHDNGQADAIVRGFTRTTGGPNDLMAWINSDDFYLPGTLAYVTDYFARHPEVDVLYGHRIVVNEESQEIARWFLPQHDDEVLRLNDFVPQETMFWRRRIWDKVGGLDASFKFAMDWDLLLRFQAAGAKIVRVPYFLACFRVHAAQKTSAAMHSTGQKEITLLRERTFGRFFPAEELERNPRLLRYLRRSAFIEFLWKSGIRSR